MTMDPGHDDDKPEPVEDCPDCGGLGGYDASTDCEVYDDWHDCEMCGGTGEVPLGFPDRDIFIPERDAFMAGD